MKPNRGDSVAHIAVMFAELEKLSRGGVPVRR